MTEDPRIEAAARAAHGTVNPSSLWEKLEPSTRERWFKVMRAALAAADRAAQRPISEASENPLEQVLIWTPEGWDISSYSPMEEDGPDSMGHDGGWWGAVTGACPGRHMGNPKYHREAECQPTHYQPLPAPPEDNDDG